MNSNDVLLLEKSFLTTLIVEPQNFSNVAFILNSGNFIDSKNATVFECLQKLASENKEFDTAIIITELTKIDNSINWANYISNLITNSNPYPSNLTQTAKEIYEQSRIRQLKQNIEKVNKEISNKNLLFNDAVQSLENNIFSLVSENKNENHYVSASDAFQSSFEAMKSKRLQNEPTGLRSGFIELDNITLGFQNGDLVIVAARPSMGKTAFALNIATTISQNKSVLFFSIEMPTYQLMNRIISSNYRIKGSIIRDPKIISDIHWQNLWSKLENDHQNKKIQDLKLYIDDTAGIYLNDLVWKAKRINDNIEGGLDMIVIDYMQLINTTSKINENRQNEVALISRALKKLARDLNIPVIALSQLSRRVEQRENKVPLMSDLRESGAIEQDADLIAFLYRDSYYEKMRGEPVDDDDFTDVIIAKHRNGTTGIARLKFDPEFSKFENISKF